jgi:hypothetical protein
MANGNGQERGGGMIGSMEAPRRLGAACLLQLGCARLSFSEYSASDFSRAVLERDHPDMLCILFVERYNCCYILLAANTIALPLFRLIQVAVGDIVRYYVLIFVEFTVFQLFTVV